MLRNRVNLEKVLNLFKVLEGERYGQKYIGKETVA
jgi:hypothetical protein